METPGNLLEIIPADLLDTLMQAVGPLIFLLVTGATCIEVVDVVLCNSVFTAKLALLLRQNEVAGSVELQGSLESSVAELQQSLKQRDVDCSKMMLEVQVSHRHNLVIA